MKVSVIIPTYNYGRFLSAAVDSVLTQTLPASEVIVVDDGSTDDTRERLAGYGERVRYLYQPNQGLSAARNTGMRAARGELLALLDSDDAFHPRKLEYQVRYLTSHPAVGLIGTISWSDPTRPIRDVAMPAGRRVTLDDVIMKAPFCPSSVLMTRECAAATGSFDPAVSAAADRDYWIRAAATVGVSVLDEELTYYRLHPNSMSRNAELMVQHERAVLNKAFQMPQVVKKPLLCRKARAVSLFAAGLMYREAGEPGVAANQMMRSIATWPLPLRTGPGQRFAYRLRGLAVSVLRRWVGGRQPHRDPT